MTCPCARCHGPDGSSGGEQRGQVFGSTTVMEAFCPLLLVPLNNTQDAFNDEGR